MKAVTGVGNQERPGSPVKGRLAASLVRPLDGRSVAVFFADVAVAPASSFIGGAGLFGDPLRNELAGAVRNPVRPAHGKESDE